MPATVVKCITIVLSQSQEWAKLAIELAVYMTPKYIKKTHFIKSKI